MEFARFILWVVGGSAVATALLGGVVKATIAMQGKAAGVSAAKASIR
jgi:hypothetical protein